jgi:hypothetical protein
MIALFKILLGGFLIWASSEAGKRSGALGGLLVSLPLTSIFSLSFLWLETRSVEKVAAMSTEIIWFVVPSLVLFFTLCFLLKKNFNFPISFGASILLTVCAYAFLFKIRS